MTLEVHNFYTKEKLSTNRYHNLLMSNALFYILITQEGRIRELCLQITKKFHYERIVGYGNFRLDKVDEYNVLVDFIRNNKFWIKEKWHLTDDEFLDLLDGLKLVLINQYSTCSGLNRIFLRVTVLCSRFVRRFVRRCKK